MPESVIGSPYTFQVLFLDEINTPVVVDDPKISIFRFDSNGGKVVLVNAQAMSSVVPAEVGRYVYTYTIPTSFSDGESLHAEMQGTDEGVVLVAEQQVTAISSARGQGGSSGLVARFIK